jgi:hypothetical protein
MTATKPVSTSPLDAYWGSDSSQHVNFVGVDNHVHELYIAPNTAGWVDNDLTKLAGAQAPQQFFATPLDGYWGSDSSQHVNFIGDDDSVHELYIAPNTAGWVDNDLTKLAGGVGVGAAGRGLLNGYWGSDGSQHINFYGIFGSTISVHELYLAPGAADWVDNDLTTLAGAVFPPIGASGIVLDSYWGSDSSQHVFFVGVDLHVHELYIAPDTVGWVDHDLTKLAGAVAPVFGVPATLHGYWGSDSSQHVNFIGTDSHLHELYIAPDTAGWVDHDLTKLAAAVPPQMGTETPAIEPGLDGYWGSDNSQHVNFVGVDGHLHELYIAPGAPGWMDNDLTKLAAAVPPQMGTPLDGYWGSDNSQHVNFIGTDGDVHELYIAPGAAGWVDNNLTALA